MLPLGKSARDIKKEKKKVLTAALPVTCVPTTEADCAIRREVCSLYMAVAAVAARG